MSTWQHLLVRTATVIRAGQHTDRYGNSVRDWTVNATRTDYPAWFASSSGTEVGGTRGEAVVSEFRCFFDRDADVLAQDRVELDGVVYEVDGPPLHAWRAIPVGEHHIEVNLKRIEG